MEFKKELFNLIKREYKESDNITKILRIIIDAKKVIEDYSDALELLKEIEDKIKESNKIVRAFKRNE